jgi:hypothetical protein
LPPFSESVADVIESVQVVIAEQTSSAHAVAEESPPPSSPPQPAAREAASTPNTTQVSPRNTVLRGEGLGLDRVELGLGDRSAVEQPLGLLDLGRRAA